MAGKSKFIQPYFLCMDFKIFMPICLNCLNLLVLFVKREEVAIHWFTPEMVMVPLAGNSVPHADSNSVARAMTTLPESALARSWSKIPWGSILLRYSVVGIVHLNWQFNW